MNDEIKVMGGKIEMSIMPFSGDLVDADKAIISVSSSNDMKIGTCEMLYKTLFCWLNYGLKEDESETFAISVNAPAGIHYDDVHHWSKYRKIKASTRVTCNENRVED